MDSDNIKNISAENHEISDTDAEGAAAGLKTKDGRRMVTVGMICVDYDTFWICKDCFGTARTCYCKKDISSFEKKGPFTVRTGIVGICGTCAYCSYDGGAWHCENKAANERP